MNTQEISMPVLAAVPIEVGDGTWIDPNTPGQLAQVGAPTNCFWIRFAGRTKPMMVLRHEITLDKEI